MGSALGGPKNMSCDVADVFFGTKQFGKRETKTLEVQIDPDFGAKHQLINSKYFFLYIWHIMCVHI